MKMKKLISSVLALAIAAGFAVIPQAETIEVKRTTVLEENFNDWPNATKATASANGYTEGNNNQLYCKIITDSEGDQSFGVNQFGSLIKTFETPYEGSFGITYKATISDEYVSLKGEPERVGNIFEINLLLEDDTAKTVSIWTANPDDSVGHFTKVVASGLLNQIDMRPSAVMGENDVKVEFFSDEQKFYFTVNGDEYTATVNDTNNGVKAITGFKLLPVYWAENNGVEYRNTAAEGEEAVLEATENIYHATYDDINVYTIDLEVIPDPVIPNLKLKEDFNDWENATPETVAAQGWTGGHYSKARTESDSKYDRSLIVRGGANIIKEFEEPFTDIFGMTYKATSSDAYFDSTGTQKSVGACLTLNQNGQYVQIMIDNNGDSYIGGCVKTQIPMNDAPFADINEIKVLANVQTKELTVTVNGKEYKATLRDTVTSISNIMLGSTNPEGIGYVNIGTEEEPKWETSGVTHWAKYDDVIVYAETIEEIPELVIPYLVFEEDFNDWANATKATASANGYTEGNNNQLYCKIITDSEGDQSFGVNQFGSLVKTFETPYEGDFGVTYKSALSDEYINMNGDTKRAGNVMELNLTLEDNTSSILSIYTSIVDPSGYYTSVRGNVIAATQDMRDATIFDGENDVKVLFDYNAQKFYVTINGITKEINTTKAVKALSGFTLKPVFISSSINGVEYENTAAEGEEAIWTATGNIYHGSFDDIKVYNKPAAVTPAMTYLNMDFAYDEDDFFQKDLYSTMNYGTFTSSSFPAASETDTVASQLIKFENNELVVSNDVVNDASKPYYAVINLPDEIDDEIVELSFKAKRPEGQSEQARFEIRDTNSMINLALYLSGTDALAVAVNHENGNSAWSASGYTVVKESNALFDTGYHNYKLIINNNDKFYCLYIDDEYAGSYAFTPWNETTDHARIALRGIIVDDIVIKQSPFMTQCYYDGRRGDNSVYPADDWTDNMKEDETTHAYYAYGLLPKFPLYEYWYAADFTNYVNIANLEGADKTAMVINAIYDGNGKLISVAASEEKTLNKLAADGTGTAITKFEVTHKCRLPHADVLKNSESKTIVLESMNTLTPVYEAIVLD